MLVGSFVKLLDEVKDYTLDWSDEIGSSDPITLSVWTITPASSPPLIIDSDAFTPTTTSLFLSGGMVGEDYTLENTIVTTGANARTCQASIEVRVSYLVAEVTSYVESLVADKYFAQANITAWLALTVAQREGFIIRSTRLLDRQAWLGEKTVSTQALAWPRSNTGVDDVVDTIIPQEIVDACLELALDLSEGSEVENELTTAQKLKAIKAGSVALTYFRGAEGPSLRFPLVAQELLRKYLTGSGTTVLGAATGIDGTSVTAQDLGFNRPI